MKLGTRVFIFIFIYQNFGEFFFKIKKITLWETKISRNFPISLSKNGENSPEKKNTTRYYQSSTLSTDLLPTFWGQ